MREKLNGMNTEQMDAFFADLDERFSAATQKSFWSENGELIYVMNSGTDLKEHAEMIELILHDNDPFEHSTVVKVTDEEQSEFVSFTIGDDLEGLDAELYDEQQSKDSDAIDAFEHVIKLPSTPAAFDEKRNLDYTLPENVTLSFVSEQIDNFIQREIAKNKSFSVTLISGKDRVVLEYPEE